MREFLEDLKYERPVVYGAVLAGMALIVTVAVFMALPPAPILRVIGVTGAQTTLGAAVNAIYWSGRVLLNRTGDEVPMRVYGNLNGINEQGQLIVTVMAGARVERRTYGVADTQILDIYGAAKIVRALIYENTRLDVYPGNQAVVWVQGAPLNVRLIEAGVAKPDPNPPTNIVDSAFATYYWAIVKGNK